MINKILSDKTLIALYKKYSDSYAAAFLVEEIGSYLTDQLKNEPAHVDLLVTLALTYLLTPVDDFETSEQYCRKALEIEAVEIRSKLILAYIYDHHLGELPDDILEMILPVDSSDNKLMSAKYLFVARYYFNKDDTLKYRENLNKALGYFDGNQAARRCLYNYTKSQYDENNIKIVQEVKFYSTEYWKEREMAYPTGIIDFDFFLCDKVFLLTEDFVL